MWRRLAPATDHLVRTVAANPARHSPLQRIQILIQGQPQLQPQQAFHAKPNLQATQDQKKDKMDRNALFPESSQEVKSGTDAEVGADAVSYDPTRTSPDSELEESREASKKNHKVGDPLEVSGANQSVSPTWDPTDGPARDLPKSEPSGKGETGKRGVVNSGRK